MVVALASFNALYYEKLDVVKPSIMSQHNIKYLMLFWTEKFTYGKSSGNLEAVKHNILQNTNNLI